MKIISTSTLLGTALGQKQQPDLEYVRFKREMSWITILDLVLSQTPNSFQFTVIAAQSQELKISFLFWRKARLKLFSQTGDTYQKFLPSYIVSRYINACNKEHWEITIFIIPNSSDVYLCFLCFSPLPLEDFNPVAGLRHHGSLLLALKQSTSRAKNPTTVCQTSFRHGMGRIALFVCLFLF